MFRRFSEWAITRTIDLGYVSAEDYEEYTYGLDLILSVIVSDLLMLVIGMIMGMLWEVVVFTLMYKCIRRYSGGFHCETAFTCIISSCFMCVCVLLAIKYFPFNFVAYAAATIFLLAVLFVISPIEAVNKPLESVEFKVFGRRARIVICAVLAIFAVVCILKQLVMVKVMAISVADVTLFAVMGKAKLNYYKKHLIK